MNNPSDLRSLSLLYRSFYFSPIMDQHYRVLEVFLVVASLFGPHLEKERSLQLTQFNDLILS